MEIAEHVLAWDHEDGGPGVMMMDDGGPGVMKMAALGS